MRNQLLVSYTVALILICLTFFLPFLTTLRKSTLRTAETLHEARAAVQLPYAYDSTQGTYLLAGTKGAFYPIRDWRVPEPEVSFRAGIIIDSAGEKILYQKDIYGRRSIASLTKLITGLVASETYSDDAVIPLSSHAIATPGDRVGFTEGEQVRIQDLVRAMVISSSNDAAIAIAETTGVENFVSQMNERAEKLGMLNTHFENPVGFDNVLHFSTALDVARLANYVFHNGTWWQESRMPTMTITSASGEQSHLLVNTNRLVDAPRDILAGKTGFTEEAQGTIALAIERPITGSGPTYATEPVILVILGSNDRFGDASFMLDWMRRAYVWN
ncbi:MAG: D-alanyl-D-alanine carboxypeptidase [Parcubacteria group bacterium]|nr:D-alanyl-D-alanine carboxypeptidase [Parcubacteria group bacterium]